MSTARSESTAQAARIAAAKAKVESDRDRIAEQRKDDSASVNRLKKRIASEKALLNAKTPMTSSNGSSANGHGNRSSHSGAAEAKADRQTRAAIERDRDRLAELRTDNKAKMTALEKQLSTDRQTLSNDRSGPQTSSGKANTTSSHSGSGTTRNESTAQAANVSGTSTHSGVGTTRNESTAQTANRSGPSSHSGVSTPRNESTAQAANVSGTSSHSGVGTTRNESTAQAANVSGTSSHSGVGTMRNDSTAQTANRPGPSSHSGASTTRNESTAQAAPIAAAKAKVESDRDRIAEQRKDDTASVNRLKKRIASEKALLNAKTPMTSSNGSSANGHGNRSSHSGAAKAKADRQARAAIERDRDRLAELRTDNKAKMTALEKQLSTDRQTLSNDRSGPQTSSNGNSATNTAPSSQTQLTRHSS